MTPVNATKTRTDATSDRRTKLRLRELCEEVLASHRVAHGRDLFSSDDRQLARTMFGPMLDGAR